MIFIVLITKSEKKALSEKYPKVKFIRTMIQHSDRGHYYCVEEPYLMRALREIRNEKVICQFPARKKDKVSGGKRK